MSTVTKGRIFRVTVAISDVRLQQMKDAPSLANQALQAGADWWHSNVLPAHFRKDAHGRYGYAERARAYLKQKRGKPDLVYSNSMARDLKGRAAFKQIAGGAVELKMTARVLNFVPNMAQDNQDLYVKHKNGRGYPNLKREVKAITPEEKESVAQVIVRQLEELFGPERAEPQY